MNNKTDIIKDYMGVFPEAATQKYCEDLIEWFEYNNTEGSGGRKNTVSRQEHEGGISKTHKDSEIYWLGYDNRMLSRNDILLAEFNKIVWKAYAKFKTVYGAGLDPLGLHKILVCGHGKIARDFGFPGPCPYPCRGPEGHLRLLRVEPRFSHAD